MKRPRRFATDASAIEFFERRDTPIAAALRDAEPALSAALRSRLTEHAVKTCPGFALFPQARDVVPGVRSIADFVREIPRLSGAASRAIVAKFATDMDAIIARMPAPAAPLDLFRGTRGVGAARVRRDPAYLSTSLSAAQARHFAGRCCLLRVRLPAGGRALPLLFVSRHPVELEVLLPGSARRTASFTSMKP